MADVSRSVYLSRKLSNVIEESSKHVYDGVFSAPAATKHNASNFPARIDEYREIFPPSKASLGSTIPILDLPAVDRSVGPGRGVSSGFDYAGVFGGFGDNDGIEFPSEELFRDSKKAAKRDAQPPRIPASTRRMPSKSQEFSCSYGNDQTSSPGKTRRMPSKSQEFSCNYENDQTSSPAQARRVPSKSQEFLSNYGNDQTSSPVQTRRMPSTSEEVSYNYVNDQTSKPGKTRRMPSKSQEFSCNFGTDQTSSPAQPRRMPSKSQEFPCNYGNDQTSSPTQTRRMPSTCEEVSCDYVNDQTSNRGQTGIISSKCQESSCNHGSDQTSSPAQTRRMPSKSQEFPCNHGNDQTSSPAQMRRVPSKSQEFSCNYANDQISSPAQPRMQHSKSQEFSSSISNNQMSTNPLQTRRPFLNGEDDKLSGTSPNDLTSASALPHQTVDSVKHVSVSYNKTNQLSKDGPNGMTHIAHLHAVPGYTLLFDEAGPVRKTSFDKAKRLSMGDADFCGAVGKVSRQGKHTRAVSDLGTNQQASDHDPGFQERFGVGECDHFVNKQEVNCKPQTRSMSASNSPQSFGSSGYSRRSSRRRPNRSTNKQERNASGYLFPLLDEELDVNSAAAVSAAAVKRAIEEAEEKMRWAREFLKDLEGSGFIKATLKDSFKVKVMRVNDHSYETYGPKQNGSLKVKATRQKKCFNEEEVLIQNGYLNSKASGGGRHANEAGELKPEVGLEITSQKQLENEAARLKQKLHVLAAGVDTTMRSPAPETFEETNAHDELKYAEKSCKDEGGGEWEAAKHLSQLFTGVKNRFVSFMSKQTDTEKREIQKDAPSKCKSLEQSRERAHEVRNVDNNQEREFDLDHTEEKVEMNRSVCAVAGESAQDSIGSSVDTEICEAKDNEVNTSGSTSCPDIDMLTSQRCRPSEPEEELGYIETQESANRTNDLNQDMSTEVKGELLQEVRELNKGMLDETVKIEQEIQMGTVRLEEREDLQEKACQSQAYDDKVKNREDNEEIVDEVPCVEPIEKGVDESLNNEVVTSRKIEGCNFTDSDMQDAQMKQEEDVRMVEETCMVEECYERRVGAEEIYRGEDTERIAGQDVTGEATEGLIEVVDDISQRDDISDQDDLFLSKNEEASVPDNMNQYVQGVKFSSEEKERMTESATFDPKEDVEHPQSVQRTNELIGEGVCEQTPCSIEVVDDDSEHDEYLPAVDDILEQDEFLSSSRNEEASEHDIVSKNGLDVDLPSQKGRLTEATSVTFEPEGNTERSRSVQMADELNGECSSENSGSHSEAADESLEHDDYLPTADDVCEKDEHSCFNRNAETGDQVENQYAQEGKVAVVKERMTTGGGTSEYERTEQPSSRQMANDLMGEELTKTSISAGDRLDLDNMEKEIEEANDASPRTDVEITERDTVVKYEQKHSDEECKFFSTDIGPENQDDESEVSTREANEHDASSHNSESSHKRRRWFVSRVEVSKVQRPGIFQGNERTLVMDQENAESLAVEDRVEICDDEIVNNPDEGVRIEQADVDSDQDQKDEGLQSNEGAHRRRRWFENSSEKVQLKPSPSNGIGVTEVLDHEIAHDFEHDVSSQTVDDKLVKERKYGADGVECSNMTSDRANTEAGHRRRRWFENGENLGAAQAPGPAISEDNGATATLEEEIKVGADTTKNELHETSSSEESTNAQQSEGNSKAREKEKERLVVERAIREARQRAFAEARERAAAETRLKAAAAVQDRPGKASSEAKPLSDKASMDAKLRAERAAVERATAEARERALQKSVSEKVTFKSREKVDFKNLNSGPSSSGYPTSVPFTSDRPNGAMTESPQRKKAILERNNRISEKASKALEEKNMRDVLVQKEQAERSRFAGVLDAEVKRWSTGKEGNLRSLLSTLQYVLGPESGWQPIPLTDLVTTTAVRKAYKRAALCVHPDKLQQRRATVQQKYICEKVFDLLKDAWHKFNPEDR